MISLLYYLNTLSCLIIYLNNNILAVIDFFYYILL